MICKCPMSPKLPVIANTVTRIYKSQNKENHDTKTIEIEYFEAQTFYMNKSTLSETETLIINAKAIYKAVV